MAAFSVPRSPNPACGYPAPGSPVGSCSSHTGGAGSRQQGKRWPLEGRPQRAARLPTLPSRRPRRPSSLFTPRWTGFGRQQSLPSENRPSLQHVMHRDSPTLAGGNRQSDSRRPAPFNIPLHLGSLPSTGITRRRQYCRPLRNPAGPACSSRRSGGCVHVTDGASRVAASSILQACRRQYHCGSSTVLRSLTLPYRHRPSPYLRRVGFRNARFEACAAFTNVPACQFAELLNAAL